MKHLFLFFLIGLQIGCSSYQGRKISSVDDSSDTDIVIKPGERRWIKASSWVRGEMSSSKKVTKKKAPILHEIVEICECNIYLNDFEGIDGKDFLRQGNAVSVYDNETRDKACEDGNSLPDTGNNARFYILEAFDCREVKKGVDY
jgi:hypothetical protein